MNSSVWVETLAHIPEVKPERRKPGEEACEARWRRQDEEIEREWRMIECHGSRSVGRSYDAEGYPTLEGPERWCARGHRRAAEATSRWRALVELSRSEPRLAVILVRLYGSAQPGERRANPFAGNDSYRSVAEDYARVGSTAGREQWSALMSMRDPTKRKDESDEAHRAKLTDHRVARSALIVRVAAECERLIGDAVRGYLEHVTEQTEGE